MIQNHEGLIMLTWVGISVYFDDGNVAEAEALCFGLRLAREVGVSPLVIELD